MKSLDIRASLALILVGAFVGALAFKLYMELEAGSFEKTLESLVTIAVGYFLGSSKSSSEKDAAGRRSNAPEEN